MRLLGSALALAALTVVAIGCRPDPVISSTPNIVVIIIDTLRADKVSAYGYPRLTSPEIDSYASRGVRFATTIAQSSWTRPSIGAMITGRYPRVIGIYTQELHALGLHFTTLAEILADNGYTTVGSTANPNINSAFQFDQGFDHYIDSDILWPWMGPESRETSAALNPFPSSREVFDGVLEWTDRNGAPPYYVQVDLMEVHEARHRFVRETIDTNLFVQEPSGFYLQALYHVSVEIGRFIEKLSQRPGWENTLYVITSDHGEGLVDHPDVGMSTGHGLLLYESQVLVPLIFYNPAGDLPRGLVIEERVRLLDLTPTLLDYAGVPSPGGMDGVSLLPLLRGEDERVALPEHFMVESEFKQTNKIGLYSPEWKYIENRDQHPGTNPVALHRFGVTENGIATDLAAEYPEIVGRLGSVLHDWERSHPKAPPSIREGTALSPAELEQLRSLGYLD